MVPRTHNLSHSIGAASSKALALVTTAALITVPLALVATIHNAEQHNSSSSHAGGAHKAAKRDAGSKQTSRARQTHGAKQGKHQLTKSTKSGAPAAPVANDLAAPIGNPGSDNSGSGETILSNASTPTKSYVDLNPIMRAYCDTLGVLPGDDQWKTFGCALFPGQTGGQSDFGWRQDHNIPPIHYPKYKSAAKAILANAGYRPTFYFDMQGGMRKGYGRPWDWTPEPGLDEVWSTGWMSPNHCVVVGHDAQHLSLKFLAALAAGPDLTEECIMAKVMMWRFSAQIGGMLRTQYFKESLHSSREVGRLFDFAVDCAATSWIDDQDAESFVSWAKNTVLPAIGQNGVGFVIKPGDEGYKIEPNLGEVAYWFPWQDSLMAAGMDRLGRYLEKLGPAYYLYQLGLDLRAAARKVAKNVASVITDDGACPKAVGMDGKLSWVENEKYGYSVWCYRALRVADAHAKADKVFSNFKNAQEWWSFFVEPDDSWNPNLPMAK